MSSSEFKQHEMELALREVINTLQDGQKGFAEIGERLKDGTLRRFFLTESLKRAGFRAELENELHRQGVADVREDGTAIGTLRRTWAELKTKFGGGDLALLETAEQGEDEAKKTFADALAQELPLPIHQLVSAQYGHVLLAHDFVREQRDLMRMKKAG